MVKIQQKTSYFSLQKALFFFFLVIMVQMLVSCGEVSERLLDNKKKEAELRINEVQNAVKSFSFDSLQDLFSVESDIGIYIFKNGEPIFWSSNAISLTNLSISSFNQWYTVDLGNAECLCRWSASYPYTFLALIPLRWHIDRGIDLSVSFSYRDIHQIGQKSGRYWLRKVLFCWVLVLVVMLVGGFWYIFKKKGWQNAGIRLKFVVIFIYVFLFCSSYVMLDCIRHSLRQYEEAKQQSLSVRSQYIQYALQNLYPWGSILSSAHTYGLNIDLRDLAYNFNTDIHVFNLDGQLVGSSSPELFDKGLLFSNLRMDVLQRDSLPCVLQESVVGKPFLTAYTDFLNGNYVRIGYICLQTFLSDKEERQKVLADLAIKFPPYLLTFGLILVIVLVLLTALTRRLNNITLHLRNFRIGDTGNHINSNRQDEIGGIVQAYNRIVDAIEMASDKLLQSERESAWRTMARQIAHEINNPLTPMKLTIQQLQRLKSAPDDNDKFNRYFDKATTMLIEQIDGLSHIAFTFSNFAKMPTVHIDNVDIAQKLTSCIRLFANNEWKIPIRYVGADKGVDVIADKELISHVFNNLIKNALQATANKKDGDIIIILRAIAETPYPQEIANLAEYIEITISDNGHGISKENQQKIFMPNFTTKSTGTGLGLAISKNILVGCGGKIWFSTSDKGTTFFIYLLKGK